MGKQAGKGFESAGGLYVVTRCANRNFICVAHLSCCDNNDLSNNIITPSLLNPKSIIQAYEDYCNFYFFSF